MTLEQSTAEHLRQIAKAVRDLADGLSRAERNQRESAKEIRDALVEILETVEHLKQDSLTAEILADSCTRETIDRARTLIWQRERGEAQTLPPPPYDLVPEKQRDDEHTGVMALAHARSGKQVEPASLGKLLAKALALAIAALSAYLYHAAGK